LTYFELHSSLDAKSLQLINFTENVGVYCKPALISISSQNGSLKMRIILASRKLARGNGSDRAGKGIYSLPRAKLE
jgi:hypothetical protein